MLALLCSSSWAVNIVNEDFVLSPVDGTESANFSQVSIFDGYAIFGSTWQESSEGVDSGAVFVYSQDGTDWYSTATLSPSGSNVAGIHYGEACVINGSTIVVGAPHYSVDGEKLGAIYIYEQAPTNAWEEVAMITCPTGEAGSLFGSSVALDGNNLVVGSIGSTATINGTTYSDGGQAFVFNRNEGGEDNWGLVSTLTGSATSTYNANFGKSVDIDGDLLTVGAWLDTTDGNAYAGQAYVFEFDGSDWNEVTTLNQSVAANSKYGVSTAIDGNYIVVGASEDDLAGNNAGAAYVYARDEGGQDAWGQVAVLTASDAADVDLFGADCAIDNGVVAIGAYRADGSGTDQGAVYTFGDGAGNWNAVAQFLASDASDSDMLGYSVALEGNLLIATALRGDGAARDSGEGYFFTLDGSVTPDKVPGDANNDGKVDGSDVTILAGNWQYGVTGTPNATWSMGDFNGDGKVDGSDVTILAGNWQHGVNAAASAVPEPSTILLIVSAIAGLGLVRRRK